MDRIHTFIFCLLMMTSLIVFKITAENKQTQQKKRSQSCNRAEKLAKKLSTYGIFKDLVGFWSFFGQFLGPITTLKIAFFVCLVCLFCAVILNTINLYVWIIYYLDPPLGLVILNYKLPKVQWSTKIVVSSCVDMNHHLLEMNRFIIIIKGKMTY